MVPYPSRRLSTATLILRSLSISVLASGCELPRHRSKFDHDTEIESSEEEECWLTPAQETKRKSDLEVVPNGKKSKPNEYKNDEDEQNFFEGIDEEWNHEWPLKREGDSALWGQLHFEVVDQGDELDIHAPGEDAFLGEDSQPVDSETAKIEVDSRSANQHVKEENLNNEYGCYHPRNHSWRPLPLHSRLRAPQFQGGCQVQFDAPVHRFRLRPPRFCHSQPQLAFAGQHPRFIRQNSMMNCRDTYPPFMPPRVPRNHGPFRPRMPCPNANNVTGPASLLNNTRGAYRNRLPNYYQGRRFTPGCLQQDIKEKMEEKNPAILRWRNYAPASTDSGETTCSANMGSSEASDLTILSKRIPQQLKSTQSVASGGESSEPWTKFLALQSGEKTANVVDLRFILCAMQDQNRLPEMWQVAIYLQKDLGASVPTHVILHGFKQVIDTSSCHSQAVECLKHMPPKDIARIPPQLMLEFENSCRLSWPEGLLDIQNKIAFLRGAPQKQPAPLLSPCIPRRSPSVHRMPTVPSQISPLVPQRSPMLPQRSAMLSQRSPMLPQRSPMLPQLFPMSPVVLSTAQQHDSIMSQHTTAMPQQSHVTPHQSFAEPAQSFVMSPQSHVNPQQSSPLSQQPYVTGHQASVMPRMPPISSHPLKSAFSVLSSKTVPLNMMPRPAKSAHTDKSMILPIIKLPPPLSAAKTMPNLTEENTMLAMINAAGDNPNQLTKAFMTAMPWGQRHLNSTLLKAFVRAILAKPGNLHLRFAEFMDLLQKGCPLSLERKQALSQIGVGLLLAVKQFCLWDQGFEVLQLMHNMDLCYYQWAITDKLSLPDLICLAVEVCLNVQNTTSVFLILKATGWVVATQGSPREGHERKNRLLLYGRTLTLVSEQMDEMNIEEITSHLYSGITMLEQVLNSRYADIEQVTDYDAVMNLVIHFNNLLGHALALGNVDCCLHLFHMTKHHADHVRPKPALIRRLLRLLCADVENPVNVKHAIEVLHYGQFLGLYPAHPPPKKREKGVIMFLYSSMVQEEIFTALWDCFQRIARRTRNLKAANVNITQEHYKLCIVVRARPEGHLDKNELCNKLLRSNNELQGIQLRLTRVLTENFHPPISIGWQFDRRMILNPDCVYTHISSIEEAMALEHGELELQDRGLAT